MLETKQLAAMRLQAVEGAFLIRLPLPAVKFSSTILQIFLYSSSASVESFANGMKNCCGTPSSFRHCGKSNPLLKEER
jgi:hypothetical protein